MFTSETDSLNSNISKLQNYLLLKIHNLLDRYSHSDKDSSSLANIMIEVKFYGLIRTSKLPRALPMYNSDLLDILKKNDIKYLKNTSKLLPNSGDINLFGELLDINKKELVIEQIKKRNPKILDSDIINILDNTNSEYYSKSINNEQFFIVVNRTQSSNNDNFINMGVIYNQDGYLVDKFTDQYKLDALNTYTRKIGNISNDFNLGVDKTTRKILKFDPIPNSYPKEYYDTINNKFGSFDIETYEESNGVFKPYALGFSFYSGKHEVFYLDETNLNSDLLFDRCFEAMLTSKYKNHIFYLHNLAKFDIVYILKYLNPYLLEGKASKYKVELLNKDDNIISMKITSKTGSIKLVDSYKILTDSLANLNNCKFYLFFPFYGGRTRNLYYFIFTTFFIFPFVSARIRPFLIHF